MYDIYRRHAAAQARVPGMYSVASEWAVDREREGSSEQRLRSWAVIINTIIGERFPWGVGCGQTRL